MNQDQVKEKLLSIKSDVPDFSVIFTGKESRRVEGLYKPESREILIHNKNFSSDNTMLYTAVHEFAHHVHFTSYPEEVTGRAHTNRFWTIFHDLLDKAERTGIYENVFETDPEFKAITERIRNDFLSKNGNLMKEFGKILIEVMNLCKEKNVVFEDYTERILGMDRGSARTLMKVYSFDVDENLGFDKMKTVAAIRNPKERAEAVDSFREGQTFSQVRRKIMDSKKKPESEVGHLQARKKRLENDIVNLTKKLKSVEKRLMELESEVL